jgi:hypothetical protein
VLFGEFHPVPQAPGDAIEAVDDHAIDAALFDALEQAIQRGAGERAAAFSRVVEPPGKNEPNPPCGARR